MKPALPIELLEDTHDFPCDYTWKVIAATRETLETEAQAATTRVLGDRHVRTRTSQASAGRFLCVTLEARVEGAHEVVEVYASLQKIVGLRMLM